MGKRDCQSCDVCVCGPSKTVDKDGLVDFGCRFGKICGGGERLPLLRRSTWDCCGLLRESSGELEGVYFCCCCCLQSRQKKHHSSFKICRTGRSSMQALHPYMIVMAIITVSGLPESLNFWSHQVLEESKKRKNLDSRYELSRNVAGLLRPG